MGRLARLNMGKERAIKGIHLGISKKISSLLRKIIHCFIHDCMSHENSNEKPVFA